MKTRRATLTVILITLLSITLAHADTEVEGPVEGIWTLEGSPYIAIAEITVQEEDSLVIEPGVEIQFRDRFRFVVFGYLNATGTENDSILFSHVEAEGRWNGIRLIDPDSLTILSYCVITNGTAMDGNEFNEDGSGGNLFIQGNNVLIENCRVSNGIARSMGGGIAIWNCSPTIRNCLVNENFSYYVGAGFGLITRSNALIEDCRIENNQAQNDNQRYAGGGGMYIGFESNATVRRCDFIGNIFNIRDGGGGGLYIGDNSNPEIAECNFIRNGSVGRSGDGGAVAIRAESSPHIHHCTFEESESVDSGGAFYIRGLGVNPLIEYCIFRNNTITDGDRDGGAVYIREGSGAEVRFCQFIDNVADMGGALSVKEPPRCNIHHNLFRGNGCRVGGAAIATADDLQDVPLVINNCTFVNQTFTGIDPVPLVAFPRGNSRLEIRSSIIWDANPKFPEGNQNITVEHCQIRDGFEGEGNSPVDPRFYSPDQTWWVLSGTSPCIDSGAPNLPQDPDGTHNDRGWMYFPQDALESIQIDTLRSELLTDARDTLIFEYHNETSAPVYLGLMDLWMEGAREAMFDVSGLTGDGEIHGVAFTQGFFYLTGSNNGREPNKIYCLDRNFNFCRRFDQPGDRGGQGFLDLASDGFDWLYGGNNLGVMEFATDSEPGDPLEVHYAAQPTIEYIRSITMDLWNPLNFTDFYFSGDEGFIIRADGDMWERDRIQIGDTVFGLGIKPNTRALYMLTEPNPGQCQLSLVYPDDHAIIPVYDLMIPEGYSIGGIDITQDWIPGLGHLIGVYTGEENNGDRLFVEELYTSWIIMKPETKLIMPGDSASWEIEIAGDQVPAGRYTSTVDLVLNGFGSDDNRLPALMLSTDPPPDTTVVNDQNPQLPQELFLSDIYPNPFNATATFTYDLPNRGWVKINIYDTQGRFINNLVDDFKQAGHHSGLLNGANLPSGEYFVHLVMKDKMKVKSVLLMK